MLMPSLHYRTNNNARPVKHTFCAVVIAISAILAFVGSFQFVVASSSAVQKEEIAIATIDNYGDATLSNKNNLDASKQTEANYISTKFEVSGKVQGVSFRRYTQAKATELGLMGWCRNTPRGTVEGEYEYEEIEGGAVAASSFQRWLCNVGSPKSRIDECKFEEKEVVSDRPSFDEFVIIR